MRFFNSSSNYFSSHKYGPLHRRGYLLAFLVLGLILTQVMTATLASAASPAFNTAAFASTWQRVDNPVQAGVSGVARGYTWGFQVIGSQGITTEPYNGGTRQVQYFDKARMEINNPNADPNSLFFVTNGLLVKELVTGQRQDGDNTFTRLTPSTVQVVGDSNDNGANPTAPTYASFANIDTFAGKSSTSSPGSVIVNSIDKAGTVTPIAPVENRLNKGYDPVTGHNIADVFVDYMNQTGLVWNGSAYTQDALFYGNPVYVFGRPLTEPYWTTATVKGVTQSVLVQLFERRVLTYTPANPDPYKVEMGNVGQHYFKWRYQQNGSSPVAVTNPPANPDPSPTPAVVQSVQKVEVSPVSAYAGDKFTFTGSGFAPNEPIHLWTTDPQKVVLSLIATTSDANGNFTYNYNSRGPLSGVWSITAHGVTSGKEATATFTLVDFVADNGKGPSIVLSRTHGTINDRIDIHGSYFLPNEMFSYWITAPDGTVYAGPQTPSFKHVSEYGEVNIHAYQLPKAQSGIWAITIYGQYSHRLAVTYFSYDK